MTSIEQRDAGFAVATHVLSKHFGSDFALENVNLRVPEGSI